MGITARNFAALLILINLFSWHSLLLVLGDRSLPSLSSFLGFLPLFLPGFSSGNWKQKNFFPTFLPFSVGIRLPVYFKNSARANFFFCHIFIIARLSTLLSQTIVTYSLSLSKHLFAQNICRNTVLRS